MIICAAKYSSETINAMSKIVVAAVKQYEPGISLLKLFPKFNRVLTPTKNVISNGRMATTSKFLFWFTLYC